MRVVGVDLGTRRIGVAVSDALGSLASPYEVILRTKDAPAFRRRLATIVREVEAERVVVGLPLSMDGSHGPAAQSALAEVEVLAAELPVPVETFDERLTSVSANRVLREAGRNSRQRRDVVDKVAAAVMLQAWLDVHGGQR